MVERFFAFFSQLARSPVFSLSLRAGRVFLSAAMPAPPRKKKVKPSPQPCRRACTKKNSVRHLRLLSQAAADPQGGPGRRRRSGRPLVPAIRVKEAALQRWYRRRPGEEALPARGRIFVAEDAV